MERSFASKSPTAVDPRGPFNSPTLEFPRTEIVPTTCAVPPPIASVVRRGFWTTGEVSTLRRLYSDTPMTEMISKLGRSMAAIYGKAKELGLKRSAAFLAGEHSGRMRSGSTRGATSRFKNGSRPRKNTDTE